MVRQNEEVLEHIKSLADEQYRDFHSGLCPETSNILGVRVPVLRSYAKELMDENWRETYRNVGNQYYEEVMLQGMMLGIAKITIETLIKDGRIHPTRIEEIYDKTVREMQQKIIEIGNSAIFELGLTKVDNNLIEIRD